MRRKRIQQALHTIRPQDMVHRVDFPQVSALHLRFTCVNLCSMPCLLRSLRAISGDPRTWTTNPEGKRGARPTRSECSAHCLLLSDYVVRTT